MSFRTNAMSGPAALFDVLLYLGGKTLFILLRNAVEEDVARIIEENHTGDAANAIALRKHFGRFVINVVFFETDISESGLCCAKHGRKSFTGPSPLGPEFKYFTDTPGCNGRASR